MDKKELIKQCRYYKGEASNPYNTSTNSLLPWFWDMERVWVQNNGKFNGEEGYYNAIKGKHYEGIPFTLLMVLFTSWAKQFDDVKGNIKRFYEAIDDYLEIPSDHIPQNKIPS